MTGRWIVDGNTQCNTPDVIKVEFDSGRAGFSCTGYHLSPDQGFKAVLASASPSHMSPVCMLAMTAKATHCNTCIPSVLDGKEGQGEADICSPIIRQ
jgi:hypothetical protein